MTAIEVSWQVSLTSATRDTRVMDTPLFGEQKKETKVAVWVFSSILALISLFTFIVCIIFGFQILRQHLLMAVVILFTVIILFILFRWYQEGDLDPKFKLLIALLILLVVTLCICANAYVWGIGPPPPDPSSQCVGGNGFYVYNTKMCVQVSPSLNDCKRPGFCLCPAWGPNFTTLSIYCTNCTICAQPPPNDFFGTISDGSLFDGIGTVAKHQQNQNQQMNIQEVANAQPIISRVSHEPEINSEHSQNKRNCDSTKTSVRT